MQRSGAVSGSSARLYSCIGQQEADQLALVAGRGDVEGRRTCSIPPTRRVTRVDAEPAEASELAAHCTMLQ